MFYLLTGLAGCSVDPRISRGARKLTRTPRVKKKKKDTIKARSGIEKPAEVEPGRKNIEDEESKAICFDEAHPSCLS